MGKLVVQGASELELSNSQDGILSSPSFTFDISVADTAATQWTVSSVNDAQFEIIQKP